jgi:hypothetical protein
MPSIERAYVAVLAHVRTEEQRGIAVAQPLHPRIDERKHAVLRVVRQTGRSRCDDAGEYLVHRVENRHKIVHAYMPP